MFSQTVEYALRAVVVLARNPEQLLTTSQIAEVTRVPAYYLSKVLISLAKAELINGTRGTGGGYTLAMSPEELTLLAVVNAVDPIKRIRKCPLHLPEHDLKLCALHRELDGAIARIEQTLGRRTLADVVSDRANQWADITSESSE